MQFFKVKKWLKEQRKPHQLTDQRFSVRSSSSFSPCKQTFNCIWIRAKEPLGVSREANPQARLWFIEGSDGLFARGSRGVIGPGGWDVPPAAPARLQALPSRYRQDQTTKPPIWLCFFSLFSKHSLPPTISHSSQKAPPTAHLDGVCPSSLR